MAHFAKLDENNVVVEVIVISNDELIDETGKESEAKGIAFCKSLFGEDTRWVQTSYNASFRKRYSTVGLVYYEDVDLFAPPKPTRFPSFILDPETGDWIAPIPRPTDNVYRWNELNAQWETYPPPFPSWTAQGDPLRWTAPVPAPTDGKVYTWDEPTLSWIETNNQGNITPDTP